MKQLVLPHCTVPLPAFFPDATLGAVRATGFDDMDASGLFGLEMNSFHLYTKPGARLIKSLGGLNAFTGYGGAILTDSGGFQLFSQIRENAEFGEIRDNEIIFHPEKGADKVIYTPEKSVQTQFQLKTDIIMALDMCTHPDDPADVQRVAVERTVKWAERCRKEYDKLIKGSKDYKPLLFGIVQGGSDEALRMECGARLREIGFDGYGFGGWPMDETGTLRYDILASAARAMEDGKVKYAMGLGRPEEIVKLVEMGYTLFDCVIPTREARHQRLYVFKDGMANAEGVRVPDGKFYSFHYAMDDKFVKDPRPVDETCDCALCRRHSRAYLAHLFRIGDSQAYRLATAHNLRFYGRLMEYLR